jgi:WD40 repeat protein
MSATNGNDASGHFELIWATVAHTNNAYAVDFIPPLYQHIVSCGRDRVIRVWQLPREEQGATRLQKLYTSPRYDGAVWSVECSHSGHMLASCGADSCVTLWHLASAQQLNAMARDNEKHNREQNYCKNSDENDHLDESRTDIQDVEQFHKDYAHVGRAMTYHRRLDGPSNCVYQCRFSADDSLVACGSDDMSVRAWSVQSGQCVFNMEHAHSKYIHGIAWIDSRRIVSVSAGSEAIVHDIVAKRRLGALPPESLASINGIDTFGGAFAVAGATSGNMMCWELPSSAVLDALAGSDGDASERAIAETRVRWQAQSTVGKVWRCFFTRDGRHISASGVRAAVVLDAATGNIATRLDDPHFTSSMRCARFSPDGRLFATASEDKRICLFRAKPRFHTEMRTLKVMCIDAIERHRIEHSFMPEALFQVWYD